MKSFLLPDQIELSNTTKIFVNKQSDFFSVGLFKFQHGEPLNALSSSKW